MGHTEVISALLSILLLVGGVMIRNIFKKQDTADCEAKQDRKDVNEKLLRVYAKFEKVDTEIEDVKDNYKSEFASVRKTINDKHELVIDKINDNRIVFFDKLEANQKEMMTAIGKLNT